MKILIKLFVFISIFFAFGLIIAKLGLVSPDWSYPNSILGWIILIILFFLLQALLEYIFDKINKRFGIYFWEKYSEKEIRVINKIIIVVLIIIVVISLTFGLLT